jgi:hypothetical protein
MIEEHYGLDAMTLLGILVITLIIIIYLAWMVRYKATSKERLLIIEKDFDLNKLSKNNTFSFPWKKTGIILASGCIGFLLGGFFESIQEFHTLGEPYQQTIFNSSGTLTLLFMYLFSGIGMIVGNKLDKSKKEE